MKTRLVAMASLGVCALWAVA
eukprot:COSAG06_NODE_51281_length_313_cov_0.724299_1_plen_20_part_10